MVDGFCPISLVRELVLFSVLSSFLDLSLCLDLVLDNLFLFKDIMTSLINLDLVLSALLSTETLDLLATLNPWSGFLTVVLLLNMLLVLEVCSGNP